MEISISDFTFIFIFVSGQFHPFVIISFSVYVYCCLTDDSSRLFHLNNVHCWFFLIQDLKCLSKYIVPGSVT